MIIMLEEQANSHISCYTFSFSFNVVKISIQVLMKLGICIFGDKEIFIFISKSIVKRVKLCM